MMKLAANHPEPARPTAPARICLRGQATLEYLLAFLILLSILLFLALPTNRFYSNAWQLYSQSADAQSLAIASLDLGMLHCAGPGLQGVPPLPVFSAQDQRIWFYGDRNTTAPGITRAFSNSGYEVLNVTHT